jgi:hypothetical protein
MSIFEPAPPVLPEDLYWKAYFQRGELCIELWGPESPLNLTSNSTYLARGVVNFSFWGNFLIKFRINMMKWSLWYEYKAKQKKHSTHQDLIEYAAKEK